jgi:hypothetical protein
LDDSSASWRIAQSSVIGDFSPAFLTEDVERTLRKILVSDGLRFVGSVAANY